MRPRNALVRGLAVVWTIAALAACATTKSEREAASSAPPPPAAAPLLEGMGEHARPIATTDAEAQRYFNQGLTLIFAFNHEEAIRSFREAQKRDPNAAMPYWGEALSLGMNYNEPGSAERDAGALAAAAKAKELAAAPGVAEADKALIDALGARYSADPAADRAKLQKDYADAMRKAAKKFPKDDDVQTLFAESMMNLRPWDLWRKDGKPQPGTNEIVKTLETVLKRSPNHPGANHYYVHVMEGSPTPEKAAAAAERLPKLVPGAGHLVHMPAHVHMRTGDYAGASAANEAAIGVDAAYLDKHDPGFMYRHMYAAHNFHFLWASRMMEGRSADAMKAAADLASRVSPEAIREMPMLEYFAPARLLGLVRFGKWEEVLQEAEPPSDLPYLSGAWRYARGMALVRQGKLEEAQAELAKLGEIAAATPADRMANLNSVKSLLAVASGVLEGELLAARKEWKKAVDKLTKTVALEEALTYDEPPAWYFPVRQSLGAVLLESGDSKRAEQVYKADLKKNPENGWSLFGLAEALKKQKKAKDAAAAEARFKKAWAAADVQLASSRF